MSEYEPQSDEQWGTSSNASANTDANCSYTSVNKDENPSCCYDVHGYKPLGTKGGVSVGCVLSSCFCFFTSIALILSIMLVCISIGNIKMQDIRDANPKYANFLLDVGFGSYNTKFVRLKTLCE